MKRKLIATLIISGMIFLSACPRSNGDGEEPAPLQDTTDVSAQVTMEEELIEKGKDAALALQNVLGPTVTKMVADSGVTKAVKFCSQAAYPLTDSISQQQGAKISRVSHKPRNPLNRANDNEMRIISQYAATLSAGEEAKPVLKESENQFTFYSPVIIGNPLCLKCHGVQVQDISHEDFIVISMLYPADEATGFKMGDLRGLWKVEFEKGKIVQ